MSFKPLNLLNISSSDELAMFKAFLSSWLLHLKKMLVLISSAIVVGIEGTFFLVFHKRRRKHSRKKNGHRQRHSKIQITKILSKNGKLIASAQDTVAKTKVKNKTTEIKTKEKEKIIAKKILKK